MSRLSMRQVLELMLPVLVADLGEARVLVISKATQKRMGDGGTPAEWLTAMGLVIAELDDRHAEQSYLRALDAVAA